MEPFIIAVGLNQDEITFIAMKTASTAGQASDWACSEFRKKYGLPTSKQVYSKIVLRGQSAEETESIYEQMMEKWKHIP